MCTLPAACRHPDLSSDSEHLYILTKAMAHLPMVDSNNWAAAKRCKNPLSKSSYENRRTVLEDHLLKKVFREVQKPDLRVVSNQTSRGHSITRLIALESNIRSTILENPNTTPSSVNRSIILLGVGGLQRL